MSEYGGLDPELSRRIARACAALRAAGHRGDGGLADRLEAIAKGGDPRRSLSHADWNHFQGRIAGLRTVAQAAGDEPDSPFGRALAEELDRSAATWEEVQSVIGVFLGKRV